MTGGASKNPKKLGADDGDVPNPRFIPDADGERLERDAGGLREGRRPLARGRRIARRCRRSRSRCRVDVRYRYTRWTVAGSIMRGGGRNSSRSTSENIAAFAPIPSASVSVTPMVKIGLRRRSRSVYVASCRSASSDGQSHTSRDFLAHERVVAHRAPGLRRSPPRATSRVAIRSRSIISR